MTVKEATDLLRVRPPEPDARGALAIKFRHSTDWAEGSGVWVVTLWPVNGRVSDVTVASANATPGRPSSLPLRTWNGVLIALAVLSAALCVMALHTAVGNRRLAARYGQIALAAAMAATLAWVLASDPGPVRLVGVAVGGALAATSLGVALRGILRRQPRPGGCRNCGYNLTGNISGVCPECGTGVGD